MNTFKAPFVLEIIVRTLCNMLCDVFRMAVARFPETVDGKVSDNNKWAKRYINALGRMTEDLNRIMVHNECAEARGLEEHTKLAVALLWYGRPGSEDRELVHKLLTRIMDE